jgi:hypothetical protein
MKNSELWAILEDQLDFRRLDDGNGGKRKAAPGEFMLMDISDCLIAFKHIHSKNYVFLKRDGEEGWGLLIPTSQDKAFHRGEFPAPLPEEN